MIQYKISGTVTFYYTDFFDVKAGVLQGDTLALLLLIIILNYVPRTSVDKHSLCQKVLKRYPTKKLTDVDYIDDLPLTSDCCKCVISSTSPRNAAKDVGLNVNTLKTEHINFNQFKARIRNYAMLR